MAGGNMSIASFEALLSEKNYEKAEISSLLSAARAWAKGEAVKRGKTAPTMLNERFRAILLATLSQDKAEVLSIWSDHTIPLPRRVIELDPEIVDPPHSDDHGADDTVVVSELPVPFPFDDDYSIEYAGQAILDSLAIPAELIQAKEAPAKPSIADLINERLGAIDEERERVKRSKMFVYTGECVQGEIAEYPAWNNCIVIYEGDPMPKGAKFFSYASKWHLEQHFHCLAKKTGPNVWRWIKLSEINSFSDDYPSESMIPEGWK